MEYNPSSTPIGQPFDRIMTRAQSRRMQRNLSQGLDHSSSAESLLETPPFHVSEDDPNSPDPDFSPGELSSSDSSWEGSEEEPSDDDITELPQTRSGSMRLDRSTMQLLAKLMQVLDSRPRDTVPSGLISALPKFHGDGADAVADARGFLVRFESVARSLGLRESRWPDFVTVSMRRQEDVAYWSHLVEQQRGCWDWPHFRSEFLRHFDRFDQLTHYVEELTTLQQRAGETCQSYFDRARETVRRAQARENDPVTLNFIRKGLRSQELQKYLLLQPDAEFHDLDRLVEASLRVEARLSNLQRNLPPKRPGNSEEIGEMPVGTALCRICRKHGHMAGQCPRRKVKPDARDLQDRLRFDPRKPARPGHKEYNPEKTCRNCPGKTDHRFSDCLLNTCATCGAKGHMNFKCPKAICRKCGARGHTERSFACPKFDRKSGNKDLTNYLPVNPLSQEIWQRFEEKSDSGLLDAEQQLVCALLMHRLRGRDEWTGMQQAASDSPFILIPIQVDGSAVIAAIDTLASISVVNTTLAGQLGLLQDAQPAEIAACSAFSDQARTPLRRTTPRAITCQGKTVEHALYVADLHVDFILGMDLFRRYGFSLNPLPFRADMASSSHDASELGNSHQVPDTVPPSDGATSTRPSRQLTRIPEHELRLVVEGVQESLDRNMKIGLHEFCTHPAAELSIPIPLDVNPTYRPQYAVPEKLKPVVDEQIDKWVATRKIEPSDALARWNCALLLAPKRDLSGNRTEWRLCFDARPLNEHLPNDTYGIPRIKDLFARVRGFQYCSSLDLVAAYQQIPIRAEDRHFTTFTWRNKRYRFVGAPFGLTHIPGHFQRLMTAVMEEHLTYVLVYLDDLFIFSDTLAEHIFHLNAVIDSLTMHNLRLRPEKCHFGYRETVLLGHVIGGETIRADPLKVSTFASLPTPRTPRQLQALLGFASYLRDYIPNYARIAHPLEAIKNEKELLLHWDASCDHAFETLKGVLSHAPVLSMPDFDSEFHLATDSSQHGNGAVLYQLTPRGRIKYVAFFSKALSKSQSNYPATKRELLAIVQALKAFRNYLYGRHFQLYTDHKALVFVFNAKEPNYMLQNWFEEISEFNFTVHHRPGVDMVLPDALSRLYEPLVNHSASAPFASSSSPSPLISSVFSLQPTSHHQSTLNDQGDGRSTPTLDADHLEPMATVQATEPRLCPRCIRRSRVSRSCTRGFCSSHCPGCLRHPAKADRATSNAGIHETVVELETDHANPETIQSEMHEFIRDVAGKRDPGDDASRSQLVSGAHEFNHQGADNLFKYLFRQGYYWSTMKRSCADAAARCQRCLQYNITRRGFHPLRPIAAQLPWDHLAVDLGEIRTTSKDGHNFFLVVNDICTRFILIRALRDKSALTVARKLYRIFADLGVPRIVQSDNGKEFVNSVILQLKTQFGFKQRTITAYYPQANGAAENSVKLVKMLLKKHTHGDQSRWCVFLPAIQLALNSRVSSRHHSTPFSLMFTRPVNLFIDHSGTASQPMSGEQLLRRHRLLLDVLYPAIAASTDAYNKRMVDNFRVSNRVIEDGFPPGAMVMRRVDVKGSGMEPTYEGPFKVLSRTLQNTYVLLDATGQLYPKNAAPSQLKMISVPDLYLDEHYEVERILGHKGPAPSRSYLVKWKGYANSDNSWVHASDFDAPQLIQAYWETRRASGKRQRVASRHTT